MSFKSRHKPSSSTVNQTSSSATPPLYDVIKAVATLRHRQGNNTKAEFFFKKSSSKYKNSPPIRVNSENYLNNLAVINFYVKYLAESGERATTLEPNSLSFSLFYVHMLFELSKQNKEYDKVIGECNRALSIKKPTDPYPYNKIENLKNEIRKFKMRMMVVKIIDVDGDVESQSERDRDRELKELIIKNEVNIDEVKISKLITKCHWNSDCGTSSFRRYELEEYWDERMSDWSKKRLLQVRIEEVKEYFDKNEAAREVLKEAISYAEEKGISYAEEKGNWKFWECFLCGEKFVDCEVWVKHYEEKHVLILSERLKSVVPSGVDCKLVDMIENGNWRPVDTLALAKRIKSRLDVDNEWQWPLSDDLERAKILKRIRCMLKLFLRHKCLAVSLTGRIISDASVKFQAIIPQSEFQIPELYETLHCLRFLCVSELNNALKFLQEVCDLCGLSDDEVNDEVSDIDDEVSETDINVFDIKERITFSSDFKCLILDERLLETELIYDMYNNDVVGEGFSITSDKIITWLFDFPIEEHLASWTRDKHGGKKVFEVLATEFSYLKSLCERKWDLYNNDVEITKMEQLPESEIQSYAFFLTERRKVIVQRDGAAVFRSSQLRLNAIRDVLEEALGLSFNQFIFEDCVKDDDKMMRDCLDRANYYIQEAFRRLHIRLIDELAKIDAMIMRSVVVVQQLKLELRGMCAYDYRSIMLPLLKLFIKEHLENLVDKDIKKHNDQFKEFEDTSRKEDLALIRRINKLLNCGCSC